MDTIIYSNCSNDPNDCNRNRHTHAAQRTLTSDTLLNTSTFKVHNKIDEAIINPRNTLCRWIVMIAYWAIISQFFIYFSSHVFTGFKSFSLLVLMTKKYFQFILTVKFHKKQDVILKSLKIIKHIESWKFSFSSDLKYYAVNFHFVIFATSYFNLFCSHFPPSHLQTYYYYYCDCHNHCHYTTSRLFHTHCTCCIKKQWGKKLVK